MLDGESRSPTLIITEHDDDETLIKTFIKHSYTHNCLEESVINCLNKLTLGNEILM